MIWSHSLTFSSTSFVDRYPGRVWTPKRVISFWKVSRPCRLIFYAKVCLCSCAPSLNILVRFLLTRNPTTTTYMVSSILLCCRRMTTLYLTGTAQTSDGEPKPTISLFYLLTTSALQISDEAVSALMPLDSCAATLLPLDSRAAALLPLDSRAAALLPLLHNICFLLLL